MASQARRQARTLLTKARQDVALLREVAERRTVSDEIVGFHAQQAVEKAIKAVLCVRGVHYRRTHDIAELLDLLDDSGVSRPAHLDAARHLSPFAVELRYDAMPPELEPEGPLDRDGALRTAVAAVAWADGAVPD